MAVSSGNQVGAWRIRALGLMTGATVGALVLWLAGPSREIVETRHSNSDTVARGEDPTLDRYTSRRATVSSSPLATTVDASPGMRVYSAPGVDAWRATIQTLTSYDPAVREHLGQRLEKMKAALFNPASTACGQELARRSGGAWMLNGVVAIDLRLDGERGRITGFYFPTTGGNTSVGDEQFQSCFRQSVIGAELPCPGCKPGDVTFPFAIGLKPYFPPAPDGSITDR
jgi:hypothetical protein